MNMWHLNDPFYRLFYKLESTEKYLYHYTSSGTLLEKIITNQMLRFSPLDKTNDPRETKEWQFSISRNTSEDASPSDLTSIMNHASSIVKRNVKALCLSKDQQIDNDDPEDIFKRGYGKLRMWAQYGENHKGACLIFDKEELTKTIEQSLHDRGYIFHDSMHYTDNHSDWGAFNIEFSDFRNSGLENIIETKRANHINTYFFTKNLDWKDEQEYRYLVLGFNNEYEYFPFNKSLKAIVLGVDFPDIYVKCLKDFSIRNQIYVAKLSYSHQFFQVSCVVQPTW